MQPYWSLLTKTTFRVHLQICPSYGRVRGWVPDYNILLGIVDMGTCTFLVHGYRFKRSKSWVRIPMVIRNIHRHICTYRCTYIHNINEPTTPPLELHPCHCSDYSSHLWQQRRFWRELQWCFHNGKILVDWDKLHWLSSSICTTIAIQIWEQEYIYGCNSHQSCTWWIF